MKNAIQILVIALVILSGCKATRKVTQSTDFKSSVNTEENRSVKENKDFKENKDVNSELETVTVTTETEYYEPGVVSPSTGSGTGGLETGDRRPETGGKGAVKKETTTTTTTKKKDQDKSKVEANSGKQEDTTAKSNSNTSQKDTSVEKTKKGAVPWKVIIVVVVVVLLGVFYVLVRKEIIRIPILTRLLKWLKLLS